MLLENQKLQEKSVAEGIYEETSLMNDWVLLKFKNESDDNQLFKREVNSSFIQFHFCLKGSASFSFNDGNYRIPLVENRSLLLYNPQRDLPIAVAYRPNHGCFPYWCRSKACTHFFQKKLVIYPFLVKITRTGSTIPTALLVRPWP